MTLFFVACSSPQPSNSFARYAIVIDYESSPELNVYNEQPHVIPLVVYQLSDINSFNTLKKDKAGIIKLLEAEKFDKSVTSVHKYFVSPAQHFDFLVDRASGTKWVALVAGYYEMQPAQSTLEYQVPEYDPWDIFQSEEEQKRLRIKVYFERSSIEKR